MEKLNKIYAKDINREIQGVIKVDSETFIKQELEEYVVTDELLKHFKTFFESFDKSINKPTENIGVWISGFFGSGKSHFLKILSYILENKEVDGKNAVDYFENKITDKDLLEKMKKAGRIKNDVILFNIDSKSSAENVDSKDKILSVFEKVFNEYLGLSTIPHVAEFERYLIKNDKYEAFKREIEMICNNPWERAREDFYFIEDEIVEAYSKVLGKSIEEARNWFEKSEENYDISIEKFSNRIKKYIEAQKDDRYVIFLIDEVGQYVGSDRNALLNLQTITEDLGVYCGGKAWICVTSQAAIDDVVKVFSDEFSKITGRFNTRLSLSSSDTNEVIKKRILTKVESSAESLKLLYDNHKSIIGNLFVWKNAASQNIYKNREDFALTYPFVPYQFKLIQDVFTDIRTHGFAGKNLSSGERSLLSAFQETAQKYENEEIGVLIPFYAFYNTIEQFLEGTVKRVFKAAQDAIANGALEWMDINVLKILFMLKDRKEIPTNIDNIAILYSSNINTDKLELKKQISESLKRLEKETLIQRTEDEYKFLTDDEQEVNRAIKKIDVDQRQVTDYLKKIIFDYVLKDRKYIFKNNPFILGLYIDDTKVISMDDGIGIKIVTSYSKLSDIEIQTESFRDDKSIFVKLDISKTIDEEIYNALKIEGYIISRQGIYESEKIQTIITTKQREAERNELSIRNYVADQLKNASIYFSGDGIKVQNKEAQTRINEALEILFRNIYSKADYICVNQTSNDLRLLFEDNRFIKLNVDTAFANQKAVDDMKEYITEQDAFKASINVASIIAYYKKIPYGYKQDDIIYLIGYLLKQEYINLVLYNEELNSASQDTLNKLLQRNYYDKLIVQKRKKIDINLINTLKNVARSAFGRMDLPENEDGMVKEFKEIVNSKLMDLKELSGKYNLAEKYQYPGRNIIEKTISLFTKLNRISQTNEFFEQIVIDGEEIISLMSSVADIFEFFKGAQKENFDKAKKSLLIYEDNKDYADESEELVTVATEISNILRLEEPYSKIPELPPLKAKLNNILVEMYDLKSKPIIEKANEILKYIQNELDNCDVDKSFGERFISQIKNSIIGIENGNELKDIMAKETYFNQLKDSFTRDITKEKERLEQLKQGKNEIEVKIIPRKIVKISTLINRTYEINNELDIDNYLKELREKLVNELKENNNITIS